MTSRITDNHPLVKAEEKLRKRYRLYCDVYNYVIIGAVLTSLILFMLLVDPIVSIASFIVFVTTLFLLSLIEVVNKQLKSWYKKESRRVAEEHNKKF